VRYFVAAVIVKVERLSGRVEGRERIFLGLGEIVEEGDALGQAPVAGVALAVNAEEVPNPVGEALTGLGLAEGGVGSLAKPVEQARRLRNTAGGIGIECGIGPRTMSLP
jgi:hypothetical protein